MDLSRQTPLMAALVLLISVGLVSCSLVLDFEPCKSDDQCTNPDHICTPQGICGPCLFNADCGEGESCDVGPGICVKKCDDANACDEGLGCVDEACGACGVDADCRGGEVCSEGVCGACMVDADCGGGGFICRDGVCETGCVGSGECEGGQVCVAGMCGPCTEDAQCEGESVVCSLDGACVDLFNPPDVDCQVHLPEQPADNLLWIGALLTLSGSSAESGQKPLNAIKLAIDEINGTGGGIGGLQNRPLAILACDDKGDADAALAGARHLTRVARVPAFIGPAQSRLVLTVAPTAIESGTVLISPSATAVGISSLEDNGLVWRTAPPDNFQADTLAYYAVWRLLEAEARGDNILTVATLSSNDAYGESFVNSFKTATESLARFNDISVTLEALPYNAKDQNSRSAASQALIELEPPPDVVLMVGFEETHEFMEVVKDRPNLHNAAYLLTDGTRAERMSLVFGPQDARPEFIFGSIPGARNSPSFDLFSQKYGMRHNTTPPPIWTEHSYDAAYMLAYALAATEGEPTGAALAEALKRLSDPEGTFIQVGPTNLFAAMSTMGDGGSLDLEGASGPLDFNNEVGDIRTADILRWDIDNTNPNNAFIECEVVSRYNLDASINRFWCNAQCFPNLGEEDNCEPATAPEE